MQRNLICPSCHRSMFVGDAFCSSCGTPLAERTESSGAERREHATRTITTGNRQSCASCHSPILPEDEFCATCGARHGVIEPQASTGYDSHVPAQLVEANRGKYEILRELGRGGMGYVYLARDLELDRLDAIKVLKPSMLAEDGMVERFRAEARTIAKLRHPSIVTVYGVGSAGNLYYFVMDYIEGTPLSRVLRHEGRLSISVVQAVLYQVGSALAYAHASVVHRDVKPGNVMLTRSGRAVVTDFGIAKVTEGQAGLTRTGVLMGTPEYMSPEQCREAAVTHHADQYALGAVAFAMLTGAPPFTGQWLQVAAAHQNNPVPRLRELRPDCPDDLAEAIERMLAKYPTERWPTINDALRHLELRPLAPDDPALVEIGNLVSTVMESEERRQSHSSLTPVSSRTPTDLRIVPPPEDVELGDVIKLHASMVFDDGVEREGEGLQWESTDPSIARVTPHTGELQAVGVGSVQITAWANELSGSLALGVQPQRVVELQIQPRRIDVECGQSVQLLAEPRNKHGERLDRRVNWSSSDPRAVGVSDDGRVTAHKVGSANVLAHCEGAGSAALVVVHAGMEDPVTGEGSTPATGGRLPEGDATVAMGGVSTGPRVGAAEREHASASADHTPGLRTRERTSDSGPADATRPAPRPARPTWRRPLVVVPTILVAAAASAAPFLLSPSPSVAVALRVTHAQTGEPVAAGLELPLGGSLALSATATDEDGNALDRPVLWRSGNESVASVDGAGVLIAAAGGVATITATVDSITREIPVTVSVAVASLAILGEGGEVLSDVSLDVGETRTLSVRVLGEDGSQLEPAVSWRSTDEDVVVVANGRLIALRAGSAMVEASAEDVAGTLAVGVREEVAPAPPPVPMAADIIITGAPFATLYLNGDLVGEEQRTYTVTLLPGRNRIRLVHPAFPQYDGAIDTRTLAVEPGQERPQVVIQLTR